MYECVYVFYWSGHVGKWDFVFHYIHMKRSGGFRSCQLSLIRDETVIIMCLFGFWVSHQSLEFSPRDKGQQELGYNHRLRWTIVREAGVCLSHVATFQPLDRCTNLFIPTYTRSRCVVLSLKTTKSGRIVFRQSDRRTFDFDWQENGMLLLLQRTAAGGRGKKVKFYRRRPDTDKKEEEWDEEKDGCLFRVGNGLRWPCMQFVDLHRGE